MNRIGLIAATAAISISILSFAAPALAVERFASPTGINSGNCDSEGAACTLDRVVNVIEADGDIVTLLPGNYTASSALIVDDAVLVRGKPGEARPVLTSTSIAGGFNLNDPAVTLRRLEIVHNPASGASSALVVVAGAVEQVIARSNNADTGAAGCQLNNFVDGQVTIRDSLCVQTGIGSGLNVLGAAGANSATARNVTAVSAGDEGIFSNAPAGTTTTLNATNVIAQGGGGAADVEAQASGGGAMTINLDHSNYDAEAQFAGTAITDPGTGTNQTSAPLFVNAAAGDFHQLAASPTRNAGIGGAGLGSVDIDGEARTLGSAPDIGADEFTEAPPAPPDGDGDGVPDASDACPSQAGPASNSGCPLPADTGGGDTGGGDTGGGGGTTPDTDDPETEITKKPKKDLKAGDTAKVSFDSDEDGSTFECKVAKGKFKACTSPLKVKDLEKGKTKVQIRAVDAAGNVDETPVKLTIVAGGSGNGR